MKFNPTPLECFLFIFVCLAVYIWTKHGRRLRRWLQNYFRQRRGPRNLKPKSPEDCPACNRDCSLLPQCPKLEVLPWPERKSRRGRPKTIDTSGHACLNPLCDYFAISDPAIHALVSSGRHGKQRILYFKCQACGTNHPALANITGSRTRACNMHSCAKKDGVGASLFSTESFASAVAS